MADHTERSHPGRIPKRTANGDTGEHAIPQFVQPPRRKGRFLDRFSDIAKAVAVSAAIVTATVGVVGYFFRSSVEAVQKSDVEQNVNIESLQRTTYRLQSDVGHIEKQMDWTTDMLWKQARRQGLDVPEPPPDAHPTPIASPPR